MPVPSLHLPVLLLMVASVTCAYQYCKPIAGENGYDRFLRQHHDQSESGGDEKYCDIKMGENCMTNQDPPEPKCKETNSFIHASKNQIQAICDKAGSCYKKNPNLRVSNQLFSVTTCKKQGDASVYPCEYKGSATSRYIAIGCEDGLPTYFEEGIVVPQ